VSAPVVRLPGRPVGAIVAGIVATSLFGWFLAWATNEERRHIREDLAWKRHAFDHCRIVSAGSAGIVTTVVAYHCDDGHDYLSYDERAPRGWIQR
jgi:hypothetical protein